MLPEADLTALRAYCRHRAPDSAQDLRIEMQVEGRAVTIVERRPPWRGGDAEWTSLGVARLRHIALRGDWELYAASRDGRWRRYSELGPTPDIARVIQELESDPHGTFWG